ncbi:sensor histidine kinase [Robertmurraya andreesenii]|uniref:histidine kinase n=1 Tax=Anoxybacillus andreesenii TaxID=1325932 RepID=A0ABT9V9J7_9BACL|nr:HAMP domain-containing sensor histidine kinase [Robertmurraya andreesenii]MDQ0157609.1 two-component sensor histidine kinase [Robertmurraya andreesenii]
MLFKAVKAKLNLLYTGSLLIILVLFITILYVLISGAIRNQEIQELNRFFENEEHELVEEIYEDEYHELKFKPERNVFYYIYDTNQTLVKGEETISGLFQHIEENGLNKQVPAFMKEIEWKNTQLLLKNYSLQHDGKTIGHVIVGSDITDEKHLIKNIIWILLLLTLFFSFLFAWAGNFFAGQAIKPIRKSFQTQQKFVSDASHELRTPLSIFYSSVDILSSEEKENLSPFGQEILEDIKNESEMMNKLLNDLLFLARNDQQHFELELEEIDLSELLHSLIVRFTRIIPSHLTLHNSIQNQVTIKGDKVRIQELLYILLENAVRYTKEGSITCTLKTSGQEVVITIQDTGSGIPPEELPHIFDRFYRGDPSRTRDGSGLGLSIAKTIVEAHGGKIRVKSEVNKGTIFTISFE